VRKIYNIFGGLKCEALRRVKGGEVVQSGDEQRRKERAGVDKQQNVVVIWEVRKKAVEKQAEEKRSPDGGDATDQQPGTNNTNSTVEHNTMRRDATRSSEEMERMVWMRM